MTRGSSGSRGRKGIREDAWLVLVGLFIAADRIGKAHVLIPPGTGAATQQQQQQKQQCPGRPADDGQVVLHPLPGRLGPRLLGQHQIALAVARLTEVHPGGDQAFRQRQRRDAAVDEQTILFGEQHLGRLELLGTLCQRRSQLADFVAQGGHFAAQVITLLLQLIEALLIGQQLVFQRLEAIGQFIDRLLTTRGDLTTGCCRLGLAAVFIQQRQTRLAIGTRAGRPARCSRGRRCSTGGGFVRCAGRSSFLAGRSRHGLALRARDPLLILLTHFLVGLGTRTSQHGAAVRHAQHHSRTQLVDVAAREGPGVGFLNRQHRLTDADTGIRTHATRDRPQRITVAHLDAGRRCAG